MKATREFVQQAYDIYAETHSFHETGRRMGVGERTVRVWVEDPGRWDPYLDMVAIERALMGDRKVFHALTRWELDEVYIRLQEILDAYHPQEDSERLGEIYDFYRDSWGINDEGLRRQLLRKVRSRTAA